jgi:hypothetical protein
MASTRFMISTSSARRFGNTSNGDFWMILIATLQLPSLGVPTFTTANEPLHMRDPAISRFWLQRVNSSAYGYGCGASTSARSERIHSLSYCSPNVVHFEPPDRERGHGHPGSSPGTV